MLESDIWHCLNKSALNVTNTNTLPARIIPLADSTLSIVGALFNLFTAFTILVRCKRIGKFPTSSFFYINVCLANFIECINSIVIHYSSKFEGAHQSHSDVNYALFIASGIEDIVHFVRHCLFLPIYLARLLSIVRPHLFIYANSLRMRKWELITCFAIWGSGIVIGGFRCFFRIEVANKSTKYLSNHSMNRASFWLIMVNEMMMICCFIISLSTIIYMTKLLYQNRAGCLQPEPETGAGFQIIDQKNMIYMSVQVGLKLLLSLFLIDVICGIYLNILSALVLKIHSSPGCYPALFVTIRNTLVTTSNFIYSYHVMGVVYGVCVCTVLLFQGTMRQTMVFIGRKMSCATAASIYSRDNQDVLYN